VRRLGVGGARAPLAPAGGLRYDVNDHDPIDTASTPSTEGPHAAPAARPRVIVEFVFDRGLLSIAVRNIGDRPAHNIAVEFEPTFMGMGGAKDVATQALFRNLQFLGPGREVATLLDHCAAYLSRSSVASPNPPRCRTG